MIIKIFRAIFGLCEHHWHISYGGSKQYETYHVIHTCVKCGKVRIVGDE